MGSVCVTSEIGKLKKVLLHRPGRELEHLSPETMERLLFDDIPFLYGAQKEHDRFAEILRENGTEVLYLDTLTAEALQQDESIRASFIREFTDRANSLAQSYRNELIEYLSGFSDPLELVHKTMEGVCLSEMPAVRRDRLACLTQPGSHFILDPIPNLYFTRDPFACIGSGVSLNRMSTATRGRETLYGKYILRYHPDFSGNVPLYYTPEEYGCLEGGDILVLDERVIAVGISQRTQPEAAERLAENIFRDRDSRIDTVLAFDIPRSRAFMHLDTVFTQVDVNKFTVHPGILDQLRVFELTGSSRGEVHVREIFGTLERILEKYLHLGEVRLIRCGGSNRIASEREQWNDGSNTLCIAPGVVIVYDRNYVTNEILEASGITVLKMPSSELSRGRGGPRCMSMPLERAFD
ncbi:MAG: arginine deiminase [Clostridia bacterium]|nr:arginine deiminase [Clostridia bacterium]